jgi:hypothetical protein
MKGSQLRNAVVVGFDYYSAYLADLINEHSHGWKMRYFGSSRTQTLRALVAVRQADALVCFGGPGPDAALIEAARGSRIPVIVIWAGTDVIVTGSDPGMLEVFKQYGFVNVSDGPWLVDELRLLGIEARYVPVTAVRTPEAPLPLPSEFSVISYLPEPRRAFYGEKSVYAIARALPEVAFNIVGRGAANFGAPANVKFLGHVNNMPERLDQSTVLLRLPEHDGKSMLVLEALARGRHVVWNYDFPGVCTARDVPSAITALRTLKTAHEQGVLDCNLSGLKYVSERFRRDDLARNFVGVLDEAVRTKSKRTHAPSRRVAISGYNLFTAQVADALQQSRLDWEPRLLRVNSNLERLTSFVHLVSSDVWYSIGEPIGDRWLRLLAAVLRKPRVVHWVGSDLQTLNDPRVTRACRGGRVRNLAEVDWTMSELQRSGLRATLAPLPPRIDAPAEQPPLPARFTILLYIPRSRCEFYGRREYERLFRTFAGRPVRFLVVGDGDCYAPEEANVTRLGWCTDLRGIYEQTSALLRFTEHDGLSLMALEALAYGRNVLWTQEFPFTTRVASYADCEREIAELLHRHEAGLLVPRVDAAQYVRETYDQQRCIANIACVWTVVSSRKRLPVSDRVEAHS